VRFHWTVLIGALVFSRFQLAPGAWLGFVLLVLIHEIGHAFLVMRFGLWVDSIDIHGLGGLCRFGGRVTDWNSVVIAWGGVAAQAILGVLTLLVVLVAGEPADAFTWQLYNTFTYTNLWVIGLNLIPLEPLDGAQAWRITDYLPQWKSRRADARRQREHAKREQDVKAELERLEALDNAPPPDEVVAQMDEILKNLDAKKDR